MADIKVPKNHGEVKNLELLAAQAEMRKNYDPKTQTDVVNAALKSTFLVPAIIDKKTRLVADKDNKVKFDDRPQAKFLLTEHPKLGTFLPVFTDDEQAAKFESDEPFEKLAMRFHQVASLVEQMPNVNGFVVNPFGDALPFNKQLLDEILKQLVESQKAQQENKE